MRDGDPDIKPISGEATERAIPQAGREMVVPSERELPNEVNEPESGMQDSPGRRGGSIYTCKYGEEETRPQELHSSVKYQEETADPARKPPFVAYTDLTKPEEKIIG